MDRFIREDLKCLRKNLNLNFISKKPSSIEDGFFVIETNSRYNSLCFSVLILKFQPKEIKLHPYYNTTLFVALGG